MRTARPGLLPVSSSLPLSIFEELFYRTPDAAALLTATGEYYLQNKSHAALFGYADAGLAGRSPALVLLEPSFDVLLNRARCSGAFSGTVVCLTASGARTAMLVSLFPVDQAVEEGEVSPVQWSWGCRPSGANTGEVVWNEEAFTDRPARNGEADPQDRHDLEARLAACLADLHRVTDERDVLAVEVKRAGQFACLSEEHFRQLAHYSRDVFWLAETRSQRTLYVSPAYERIRGRLCEDLYARPDLWLRSIHPQDQA
ncbi:MAG: hypothetical protein U0172_10060 [Nitrospiraceae bacterium]